MRIAIGSDHAGFDLKEDIKEYMVSQGFEVCDFGAVSKDSVDYPDVGISVAEAVAAGRFDRAVLVCGTGIGMSIAANKVRGVRAALCGDTFSARASREHNDANILVLGERVVGKGLARDIAGIWLCTGFAGGRHALRMGKITSYEDSHGR